MLETSKLNKLKLKFCNVLSEPDKYTKLMTNLFCIQICKGFCGTTRARLAKYGTWKKEVLGRNKWKSHYDRRSVSQFVLVSCPFWGKWSDVTFIWVTITFFIFHVGRPLWWEDGSVICSAITQVQCNVTLRPTVCRPVRLGTGPPLGPITRF
jgi:hypothetical protein